jgi:hypothetical protein
MGIRASPIFYDNLKTARAAMLAIAEALMIHRTLDTAMIDTIIGAALEHAGQSDWAGVLNGAAGLNSDVS